METIINRIKLHKFSTLELSHDIYLHESCRLYKIPLIFFYYKVSDTKLSAFQLIMF